MKKLSKILKFIVIICMINTFLSAYLYSQNIPTKNFCGTTEMDSILTKSAIYKSKTGFVLKPGFHASAANGEFVISADEHVICGINNENVVTTPPTAAHNISLPVGVIAGAAGVSSSGAATYVIPIFTSPGVNNTIKTTTKYVRKL